jgi:hypothetical protein
MPCDGLFGCGVKLFFFHLPGGDEKVFKGEQHFQVQVQLPLQVHRPGVEFMLKIGAQFALFEVAQAQGSKYRQAHAQQYGQHHRETQPLAHLPARSYR